MGHLSLGSTLILSGNKTSKQGNWESNHLRLSIAAIGAGDLRAHSMSMK